MLVIGVVGGVASGKSLVTEQFQQLGAKALDGDKAGHEALRQTEVKDALRQRWGSKVFGDDGEVDRRQVAQLVFAPGPEGARELSFLEQLTHPRIGDLLKQQAARLEAENVAVAILDAPVMVKAGWHRMCHCLVFVDAPRKQRLARIRQRGWTEDQFNRREQAQTPIHQKRLLADFIVDNSGAAEETFSQVRRIWSTIMDSHCP